jgi:hypothetical protein
VWCASLPLSFTLEGLSPDTLHIGSLGTVTAADDRIFSLRGHRLRTSILSCLVLSCRRHSRFVTSHVISHTRLASPSTLSKLGINTDRRQDSEPCRLLIIIFGSAFALEHALSGRLRAHSILLSEAKLCTVECLGLVSDRRCSSA